MGFYKKEILDLIQTGLNFSVCGIDIRYCGIDKCLRDRYCHFFFYLWTSTMQR